MGVGTYVELDPTGQTTVPGVYVAGNVSDLMAQVVETAAAGVKAAGAPPARRATSVAGDRPCYQQAHGAASVRRHEGTEECRCR